MPSVWIGPLKSSELDALSAIRRNYPIPSSQDKSETTNRAWCGFLIRVCTTLFPVSGQSAGACVRQLLVPVAASPAANLSRVLAARPAANSGLNSTRRLAVVSLTLVYARLPAAPHRTSARFVSCRDCRVPLGNTARPHRCVPAAGESEFLIDPA